ncbi:nitrate/sulfonate/bicarbonate ABC transporter ATP-binding protein [Acuticoccus sediminis]|uniref:Nitrate/sulfonate/bicarbonate ABC transporter ATP-binding protein n=1 Tax=Acuticoccus sediminis TaxID=2184697 RepID=A0A8B2NTN0_9HYPH|nr:ABC transporter ATP-binding protein [Acuticoccus sediminis]RAI01628.1 nitrate/sulfonate/bicarbonate ABC transporter ATP-binding protein [Acuticoccus sediminis]
MPSGTETPNGHAIVLDGVERVFESRDGEQIQALKGVNLTVSEHEFVSLVGQSGCGKSTLLRLVAGLLAPTVGRVAIHGETVTEPRTDTGLVFQSPTLLPWASILDNLLFPLRMLHRPIDAEARERALALLELVGLAGFASRYPKELSGGMQQRAGICRALMHDPDVLLMDEPFGALDALTREEMSRELLDLCVRRPKTVLFVTHSITESVLLSDRVVVMSPRPGRIQEIVTVPLPRENRIGSEASHEFQSCAQHIRDLIFGRRHAAA